MDTKGCYWRYENLGAAIYWSNDQTNIKSDVKFESVNHYNEHRKEKGYPQNWTLIRTINIDEPLEILKDYNANSSKDYRYKNLWLKGASLFIPQMNKLLEMVNYEMKEYDISEFNNEYMEELSEIFKKNKSDKSNSGFYPLYSYILKTLGREKNLNICEIGLGTNNQNIVSYMTLHFKPGGSLYSFRDFLPNSQIYGADIDKSILFTSENIKTCYVDQLEMESFENLKREFKNVKYDLFIDDGLHSIGANFNTLLFALENIKETGWIVIEDIHIKENWYGIDNILKNNGYETYLVKATKNYLYCLHKKLVKS